MRTELRHVHGNKTDKMITMWNNITVTRHAKLSAVSNMSNTKPNHRIHKLGAYSERSQVTMQHIPVT